MTTEYRSFRPARYFFPRNSYLDDRFSASDQRTDQRSARTQLKWKVNRYLKKKVELINVCMSAP